MNILITGGAGFIGSAFIRNIAKDKGNVVVNVDKLTYASNLSSLESLQGSDNYSFEEVDICDYQSILKILNSYKIEAVINLAAETHVDRSIDDSSPFIKTNIVGTYTLLEACCEYWKKLPVKVKSIFKFVHVSTDEVYGDMHGKKPCLETTPYSPSSPYSASKAGSDHLVRAWYKTYGFPSIITNCTNNYGPYQFPEKLIPLTIYNAIEGKELPLYGDGNQMRDWLYVNDHVEALVIVLNKGVVGETYNISSNEVNTNKNIVEKICEILSRIDGNKKAIDYFSLVRYVKDRPGHDVCYSLDSSKIRSQLGWKQKTPLINGLEETVKWYCNNNKNNVMSNYERNRIGQLKED